MLSAFTFGILDIVDLLGPGTSRQISPPSLQIDDYSEHFHPSFADQLNSSDGARARTETIPASMYCIRWWKGTFTDDGREVTSRGERRCHGDAGLNSIPHIARLSISRRPCSRRRENSCHAINPWPSVNPWPTDNRWIGEGERREI